MKQSTRTLPQALKEFPISWKEVYFNNLPEDFYNLSYEEKIKHLGHTTQTYYCSFKNNRLFFGLKVITINISHTNFPFSRIRKFGRTRGRARKFGRTKVYGTRSFVHSINSRV